MRMALGAAVQDVVAMIARETVWIISVGLAIGLVAAYLLARLVQSKLFGVTAADPAVTVSAVIVLAVIGLLAAALPAFRASRIRRLPCATNRRVRSLRLALL